LREIGFQIYGYNQIENIGKIGQVMVLVSAVLILIKSRRNRDLKSIFNYIVWLLLIYYAFASIVHPWYIIYLLTVSIFTNLRFPLVWSFLVVLSYYAYRDVGVVNESYWLIGFEYAALLGAVVWDLLNLRKQSSLRIRESNEAVS
jgi:alpha-1,6-mannosyltransferase